MHPRLAALRTVPIHLHREYLRSKRSSLVSEHKAADQLLKTETHRRRLLDEQITCRIVLRCPLAEEHVLEKFLSCLSVNVEAFAVNAQRGQDGQYASEPGAKDLVDSKTLQDLSDPVVALGDECEEERNHNGEEQAGQYLYMMWELDMHIARTNIQTRNPSLYLSAVAKLKDQASFDEEEEESMKPYEAASVNLLHALRHDPAFNGKKPPVLSAARLSKHVPAGSALREQPRPLKNLTRTLHRLVPLLNTRLRCTKLGQHTSVVEGCRKTLASIDVEIPLDINLPSDEPLLKLAKMQVSLTQGEVIALPGLTLPILCRKGDRFSFVFELTTQDGSHQFAITQDHGKQGTLMNFVLEAQVQPRDNGGGPTNIISTSWQSSVDISGLGPPSLAPPSHSELTITVKPASFGPIPVGALFNYDALLRNNTSNPRRAMRLKLIPAIQNSMQGPDVVSTKPYLVTPTIKPNTSFTVQFEFKALREGLLSASPLQIVEVDQDGQDVNGVKAVIPPERFPDIIALHS
ncbi:MAG: hypothetical protein Q9162_002655 [Coniocarpon cinnabarinum]